LAYPSYAVVEMKATQIYYQWLVELMDKLWDFSFLLRWHEDLRKMNSKKRG